jgi:heme-degrading monooxygenase HmoA
MPDPKHELDPSPEAIMVDVWSVPGGNQQAALDALNELFEHFRRLPGFIEGQILRSANPTGILAYARFDSVTAQQRAQDGPATGAIVRRLREIAHQNLSRYTVAKSFQPPN